MGTAVPNARILIVDDDDIGIDAIREAFDEDYEVVTASTGEQALALIAESPPDLVLLDVVMPGIDGTEVLRRIRAMPRFPPIPVILVTAGTVPQAERAALELGAEDYLAKPVSPHALRLRVRNALQRCRLLAEQRRLAESLGAAHRDIVHLMRFKDLLLAAAGQGLYGLDREGRCTFANPATLAMTGFERDELLGADPHAVFHAGDRSAADGGPARLTLQDGERREAEDVFIRKDGADLPVHLTVTPLVENGERIGAEVVLLDATERRRAETARLQARKLEALGTLAGGLSRDFQSVLALIRDHAANAGAGTEVDEATRSHLAEIEGAAERGAELVRRIAAFGRQRESRPEALSLGKALEDSVRLLRTTLPAGIAVGTRIDPATPRVRADRAQVQEALANLTSNAAHAIGPRAGAIEYRLDPVDLAPAEAHRLGIAPGRHARLTVGDNGCGMDANTAARAFDAFFTTGAGTGSGLGLSMVYGIMRDHGGAVEVDSEPGRGARLRLYFPAIDPPSAIEAPPATPVTAMPADFTGRRVMYVDDEESLVSLARRALARMGHEVTGFTDPRLALEAFRARPRDFDVVVTDLSMPQLSGFELARGVIAARPDVPVVMTTGYLRAEDEARTRAAGIRALVPKPATIQELAAVLDALLDERP